jgi:Kef-type K+ transport system membrane component KefB
VVATLLANTLVLLGIILFAGAVLGGAAERIGVPWITGCIIAGVLLGPAVADVVRWPEADALVGLAQASLAVIAFNIGCQLAFARLTAIGRSIALLALAQLLAPMLLVAAAELTVGTAIAAVLIVAAIAPATAPTTTYAVIQRRNASGPFVDRVLGILAINDAATVLVFSVISAAVTAGLAADGSEPIIGTRLLGAAVNEGGSIAAGIGLGFVYLGVRRFIEDGRPGWESRLTATLLGLLVVAIGGAITLGLSHLLVPLSLGVVVGNGVGDAEREHVHDLIKGFETPLFIVFFVLAGAHLPVSAVEQTTILVAAIAYIAGRFAGKYGGVFLGASALGLDRPTRRYLGLCFPSQGALAMGLVLALRDSPAVARLSPADVRPIDTAVSIILVAVLLSQLLGPILIDYAIRRGGTTRS